MGPTTCIVTHLSCVFISLHKLTHSILTFAQDPTYDKVIRAVLLAVYLSSQTDNNLATMDGLLGGLQGQLMGSGDAGSGTVLPIISAAVRHAAFCLEGPPNSAPSHVSVRDAVTH